MARAPRAMVSVASATSHSAIVSVAQERIVMSTPKPGKAVRGSRTGRPVMVLLDALGRRWALRVLWELGQGARTFRALREAADDVSPTVLNERLAELRELGLVDVGDDGYVLSS